MLRVVTYRVLAEPCRAGWQLHIDAVGVTECVTLDDAEDRVLDLIALQLGKTVGADDLDIFINS